MGDRARLEAMLRSAVLNTGGTSVSPPRHDCGLSAKPNPLPSTLPSTPVMANQKDSDMKPDQAVVIREYQAAAKFLRGQEKEPTAENLAKELALPLPAAQNFLKAHPDFEAVQPAGSEASGEDEEHGEDGDEVEDHETLGGRDAAAPKRRGTDRETFRARMDKARARGTDENYLKDFPSFEETAKKIATLLTPDQQDLLIKSASREWRGGGLREAEAERLGLGVAAITVRMKQAYLLIGLPNQPKRKKYINRVLKYFAKHKGELVPPAPEVRVETTSQEPPAVEVQTPQPVATAHVNGHEEILPVATLNGNGHAPLAVVEQLSPAPMVRADSGGAFLIQPPPGTKRITVVIDF